jgi:hypothetical protein
MDKKLVNNIIAISKALNTMVPKVEIYTIQLCLAGSCPQYEKINIIIEK